MTFKDAGNANRIAETEETLSSAAAKAKAPDYVSMAVERVLAEAKPGRVFTHTEIGLMLGLGNPKAGNRLDLHQKYQIGVMKLCDALLTQHQVHLASVHGEGYEVVDPREQSTRALGQLRRDLMSAITRSGKVIAHVNQEEFTQADHVRYAESQVRQDQLRDALRGTTRKWKF